MEMAARRKIRVVVLIAVVAFVALFFGARADATTDLLNGRCIQTDGQPGVMGVYAGVPTDADCMTELEYEETFGIENLVSTGVLTGVVDNGDGTVTGSIGLAEVTLEANPLDRPVAATPALEPDAPTVREVLFTVNEFTGFLIPA